MLIKFYLYIIKNLKIFHKFIKILSNYKLKIFIIYFTIKIFDIFS